MSIFKRNTLPVQRISVATASKDAVRNAFKKATIRLNELANRKAGIEREMADLSDVVESLRPVCERINYSDQVSADMADALLDNDFALKSDESEIEQIDRLLDAVTAKAAEFGSDNVAPAASDNLRTV